MLCSVIDLDRNTGQAVYYDQPLIRIDLIFIHGVSRQSQFSGGELLEKLRKQADYIILDTAPAELLVDASLLAKHVDAALYVIRADYTKMNKIRSGIETLSIRKVDILGFVFNGDSGVKDGRYGYGYGYGYGRYGRYGRYSHYSRYGKLKNTGKREDASGRVIKE